MWLLPAELAAQIRRVSLTADRSLDSTALESAYPSSSTVFCGEKGRLPCVTGVLGTVKHLGRKEWHHRGPEVALLLRQFLEMFWDDCPRC